MRLCGRLGLQPSGRPSQVVALRLAHPLDVVRRVPSTDEVELQRLRNARDAAARTVAALEAEVAETTTWNC